MTNEDTTAQDSQEQQASPEVESPKGGNAEAAKYRAQLRQSEGERDQLAAALESTRKTMIEGIAGKHLSKPEALWVAGAEIAELLDDDGNVDTEKVKAAAADVKERLGLERAHGVPIVPAQGTTPEHSPGLTPTFADAFRQG